jgi:hypothetical protein
LHKIQRRLENRSVFESRIGANLSIR